MSTNKPNDETDSDIKTVCQLNLAACKLKAKHYKDAYSICQDVSIFFLICSQNNTKCINFANARK